MAVYRLLIQNLCKQYNNRILTETNRNLPIIQNGTKLSQISFLPILSSMRLSHTFLSRVNADQLWKGVTSVSPAGRKKGRGRGSGRKVARDLNRGQVIGVGKKNMLWPGLTAPVVQGREVLRHQELPFDENREKRLFELRDKMATRKSFKIHPLERGWSGTKLPGRSLGPPDPVGEETFEGFDSRVLEFKPVLHMTADRGRLRSMSALVVVGNKKGLAGFAMAKSVNGSSAAKAAKNKAAKLLRYVELDKNSVIHDFYCEFGAVKIFVQKMPEGYGVVAHRAIKAICDVLGIKDLYAKVEGPTNNYQCLTRAFFIGLMTQKSLKQMADEKGLHVVEMRADRDFFPTVVASPSAECRREEDILPNELLDFKLHLHEGRVEAERKRFQPFYIHFPSHVKAMRDRERTRNQDKVKVELIAKYGQLKSFIQVREEERERREKAEAVKEA